MRVLLVLLSLLLLAAPACADHTAQATGVIASQVWAVLDRPGVAFFMTLTADAIPEGTALGASFPGSAAVLDADGNLVGQSVGDVPMGPAVPGILGGPFSYGTFALVGGPITGPQPAHGACYHVLYNGVPAATLVCVRSTTYYGRQIVVCPVAPACP